MSFRPLLPIAFVAGGGLLLLGCPKKATPDAIDAAVVTDGGGPGAGGAGTAEAGTATSSDDVQSVYPVDPNAPPDPVAQKLCTGLTEMPEKKRAACCGATPGVVVTSECTRTLSAAIRFKAVTLDAARVDACVAAFERTLDGCDWVGPFPPSPPAECHGLVTGQLNLGQKCRSTLECAGALRCRGVGPTTPGKCTTPANTGEVCGGTVDALATFVRQTDMEKEHPECAAGRCIKHHCGPPAPENGECQVTLDCEEGLQCVVSGPTVKRKKNDPRPPPSPRKCQRRPLPKEGEACPGGVCAGELGCIMNKCTARKSGGAACTNDFECRGGCLHDGGAAGMCGPRCDIR
jgi:hypothetical protein